MINLPPFPKVLIAGAVAAVFTSGLIWVLSETGLFFVMGVPLATPADLGPWFAWRMVRGTLWALLFLIPVLTGLHQPWRGLVVSVAPMLELFLWLYPRDGHGLFGHLLGARLIVAAIVLWLIWGAAAGWMLEFWGFGREVDHEPPPGEAA